MEGAIIDLGDCIRAPYRESERKRKKLTLSQRRNSLFPAIIAVNVGNGEALLELPVFEKDYSDRGVRIDDATTGDTITESCAYPGASLTKRVDCL